MKNVKRIVALLLTLTLILAFSACGKEGKDEKKKENTLTMATSPDFPPYEYKDGDKVVGIDAEIAQAVADKLDMELEVVSIDFDSVIAGVGSGKFDMGMAGLTVTPEREKSVAFSVPYAKAVQSVIVRKDGGVKTIDDLYTEKDGKKAVKADTMIGVQTSTTGDLYASSDIEDDGFTSEHVTKYKTGADAIQALKTGKANAVIIDNEPAKKFVEKNPELTILDAPYAEENYSIAMNKKNDELNKKIDGALEELIKDGTIQKIINKYIPAE